MMRDMGACQTPFGAFLINQGLETLPLRIERHSQNADAVAHWLEKHDKIESVSYPTLEGNPYKERAAKYLPNGCSGVISFSLKGGREAGARFIDSLKMASLLVHVADIRTCVLHPASSTHRQLTDEQLVSAGITPGMVTSSTAPVARANTALSWADSRAATVDTSTGNRNGCTPHMRICTSPKTCTSTKPRAVRA